MMWSFRFKLKLLLYSLNASILLRLVCLSYGVCVSVCLSVCLSVRLSVCLQRFRQSRETEVRHEKSIR